MAKLTDENKKLLQEVMKMSPAERYDLLQKVVIETDGRIAIRITLTKIDGKFNENIEFCTPAELDPDDDAHEMAHDKYHPAGAPPDEF